ncbi:alpha/beta hydrolase [Nocardioides sp. TRM66260-LWL]|uniref:alpha/beta hydrolase n=1 Tax=Nocardioides sp. TRM66260-LWL TaxID=2874478 RepID=UPI001CC5D669|nr:alpha/beta hydrolase [Nocardioides sp. TRM66260-LWL]MBZ5734951.1 alpha/beta hydrolase [Nocardioides sp. TRM66260-LWL]
MPVDPGIAVLLDLIAQSGYPPMHEGTPETARRGFRAMTVDSVQPDQVVAVDDVVDTTVAGVPVRVYRPAASGPVPTLVYLHGGGFVIGDLDTHDQTCRRLCSGAELVVVSVDYRLAPEHPWPAAVDDALAVARAVADDLDAYGGAGQGLGVGGDSAGGNLAAVLAQELRDQVTGQLLIYPAVDPGGDYASRTENAEGYFLEAATMLWFFAHYVPTLAEDASVLADPRLAPLHGDLDGVAPAVVVTAELDPLRDEGEAYADALRAAGVEVDAVRYDSLVHGFIDMGVLSPAAASAVDDVVDRAKRLLHRTHG